MASTTVKFHPQSPLKFQKPHQTWPNQIALQRATNEPPLLNKIHGTRAQQRGLGLACAERGGWCRMCSSARRRPRGPVDLERAPSLSPRRSASVCVWRAILFALLLRRKSRARVWECARARYQGHAAARRGLCPLPRRPSGFGSYEGRRGRVELVSVSLRAAVWNVGLEMVAIAFVLLRVMMGCCVCGW